MTTISLCEVSSTNAGSSTLAIRGPKLALSMQIRVSFWNMAHHVVNCKQQIYLIKLANLSLLSDSKTSWCAYNHAEDFWKSTTVFASMAAICRFKFALQQVNQQNTLPRSFSLLLPAALLWQISFVSANIPLSPTRRSTFALFALWVSLCISPLSSEMGGASFPGSKYSRRKHIIVCAVS